MASLAHGAINAPAHIAADLIFDFDMYRAMDGFADDAHAAWKHVQDSYPPLFWTPHHGGHWVATRGEDIRYMQETHAEFSSKECFIPRDVIPLIIPVQLDPPEHTPYRRLIMPAFLPKALVEIEKK